MASCLGISLLGQRFEAFTVECAGGCGNELPPNNNNGRNRVAHDDSDNNKTYVFYSIRNGRGEERHVMV